MKKQTESEAIVAFWARVKKNSHWTWTGTTNKGYGINVPQALYRKYKTSRAHRISFLLSGKKIPDGFVLDHMCRERSCVNPDHLRAISLKQNSTENSFSPPAMNKLKSHCSNGHSFDEKNTLPGTRNGNPTRVCRPCARDRERENRKRDPQKNRDAALKSYYKKKKERQRANA